MLSLSPDAPPALTEVLRESRSHCQRLFEVGLRTHGEALLASPPAYSMDLSVRQPIHTTASMISCCHMTRMSVW